MDEHVSWFSGNASRQNQNHKAFTTAFSDAKLPTYKYKPLDLHAQSIRLLKVGHNSKGLPTFSIVHSDIGDQDYHALSYEWGEAGSEETITIDNTRLNVRSNLAAFLRVVHTLYHHTFFWIDAICIDQSTVLERNHQVKQMGQIYRHAKTVVVWLGPAWSGMDQELAASINYGDDIIPDGPTRTAMFIFCNAVATASYFKRLWIVQEILLSARTEIVTGEQVVSWGRFWQCFEWLMSNQQHRRLSQVEQSQAHSLWLTCYEYSQIRTHKEYTKDDLSHYLSNYGSCGCADIRDRVYGLLSLIGHAEDFQVDYDETPSTLARRSFKHFSEHCDPDELARSLVTSLALIESEIQHLPEYFKGIIIDHSATNPDLSLHFVSDAAIGTNHHICKKCETNRHSKVDINVGYENHENECQLNIILSISSPAGKLRINVSSRVTKDRLCRILGHMLRHGLQFAFYLNSDASQFLRKCFDEASVPATSISTKLQQPLLGWREFDLDGTVVIRLEPAGMQMQKIFSDIIEREINVGSADWAPLREMYGETYGMGGPSRAKSDEISGIGGPPKEYMLEKANKPPAIIEDTQTFQPPFQPSLLALIEKRSKQSSTVKTGSLSGLRSNQQWRRIKRK